MNNFHVTDPGARHVLRIPSRQVVPAFAEYFYFGLMSYGMLGQAWGISLPLVAAGGLLLLAIYCLWRLRKAGISLEPIALPLACAVSLLVIQIVVHDGSIMDDALRNFVTWILVLIIIRSLCLRVGFFHRFAFVALAVGALTMPFLVQGGADVYGRAKLESSISMANANDLAAWFGFCCVYCSIVAIETRRNVVRIILSFLAIGCLFVVGLTVSRATVMAIAIATIIAARHLLKRGFLPVLLLTLFGSLVFVSGFFDQAVGLYQERGTEETGRLVVWPLAIDRFLNSPIVGIGTLDTTTYVPAFNESFTPHNSFLYFGLTSGVLPLVLFGAYWIAAVIRARRLAGQKQSEAPFGIPMLVYTFIVASFGAGEFMFPWAVVTLTMIMTAGADRRLTQILVRKIRKGPAGFYPLSQTSTQIAEGHNASRTPNA